MAEMDEKDRISLSKFLSYVLRHRPDSIGLELDRSGWVSVNSLLEKCRTYGRPITRAALVEVVTTNSKQRFAFSADLSRIRASQGHSVEVELEYEPQEPPDVLYHGTVHTKLERIRAVGIQRMKRHHVHLSSEPSTATTVGQRRGNPVVLSVLATRMYRNGHGFFLSANGVWLTEHVPPSYILFPKD